MLDYFLNFVINATVGYCSFKAGETKGKIISDYENLQRQMIEERELRDLLVEFEIWQRSKIENKIKEE